MPKHATRCEPARPFLDRIELAGGVTAPDDGADRSSGNDVRLESARNQRADHTDMGKATGGAAAERQSDRRLSAAYWFYRRIGGSGAVAVLRAGEEKVEHETQSPRALA